MTRFRRTLLALVIAGIGLVVYTKVTGLIGITVRSGGPERLAHFLVKYALAFAWGLTLMLALMPKNGVARRRTAWVVGVVVLLLPVAMGVASLGHMPPQSQVIRELPPLSLMYLSLLGPPAAVLLGALMGRVVEDKAVTLGMTLVAIAVMAVGLTGFAALAPSYLRAVTRIETPALLGTVVGMYMVVLVVGMLAGSLTLKWAPDWASLAVLLPLALLPIGLVALWLSPGWSETLLPRVIGQLIHRHFVLGTTDHLLAAIFGVMIGRAMTGRKGRVPC